jgi:hypothetical protein
LTSSAGSLPPATRRKEQDVSSSGFLRSPIVIAARQMSDKLMIFEN